MITCVKGTMITCNSILCALGLSVAIAAVVFYFKPYLTTSDSIPHLQGLLIVAMVFGFGVTVISGFGLVGAFAENSCLLITYIVMVVFTLVLSMASSGFGIYLTIMMSDKDALGEKVELYIKEALAHYDESVERKIIKKLQVAMSCCGCYNESDYEDPSIVHSRPKTAECNPRHRHVGCCKVLTDKLYDIAKPLLLGLSSGALVTAFIEIIAIVFACMMVTSRGQHSRGRVHPTISMAGRAEIPSRKAETGLEG